jgi:hypothetical protein
MHKFTIGQCVWFQLPNCVGFVQAIAVVNSVRVYSDDRSMHYKYGVHIVNDYASPSKYSIGHPFNDIDEKYLSAYFG